MTALLETRGVWQRFGGLIANSDISISVGHGEIVDDPERMLELGISVFERTQGVPYKEEFRPAVEQMLHKRVVVKIHVDKFVSWDHRKLGLPPTG